MKAGDKFNMPVTDAGDVYKVQMQVTGVAPLKTPLGTAVGTFTVGLRKVSGG